MFLFNSQLTPLVLYFLFKYFLFVYESEYMYNNEEKYPKNDGNSLNIKQLQCSTKSVPLLRQNVRNKMK